MSLFEAPTDTRGDSAGLGRLTGAVLGIVTNNRDPDKLGRVKVSFPCWGDGTESTWARIVTPMGGSGAGLCCLPEVHDEVLVAFAHGDARAPCVLGALWNGAQRPPLDNADGHNHLRTFTSRSGHQLTFDDTPKQERLLLRSRGGHALEMVDTPDTPTLELRSAAGHVLRLVDTPDGSKVELSVRGGRGSIVIDGDAVTITGRSDIRLSAPAGTLALEGEQVCLKATGGVRVEAGSTLQLRANSALSLSSARIDIN